jgi:hypothetical protein
LPVVTESTFAGSESFAGASLAAGHQPSRPGATPADEYMPGVCNIGAEEIARRRRAGHVGAIATLAVLAVLVVLHLPSPARLVVALPAAAAAIGYLQAALRFCAGFGAEGVFNFGAIGRTEEIADPEMRARDRSRAAQIALASLGIGLAVAVVAALLPI